MIKVTMGNNVKRSSEILDENTTLREALEDAGIDYTIGVMNLDALPLTRAIWIKPLPTSASLRNAICSTWLKRITRTGKKSGGCKPRLRSKRTERHERINGTVGVWLAVPNIVKERGGESCLTRQSPEPR